MKYDDEIYNASVYVFRQFYKSKFYHSRKHIEYMFEKIPTNISNKERFILSIAILFHDCIYDTKSPCNEEKSVNEYEEYCEERKMNPDPKVIECIMATKDHKKGKDKLCNIIIDLDLDILKQPLVDLIEYENLIFKEYQFVDIETYRTNRIKFLKDISSKHKLSEDIPELIRYISTKIYKIGIYAGSFNPYHLGHQNIVEKAEKLFDKVIIARGINPDKQKSSEPIPESVKNEVVNYSGLVTELFKKKDNVEFTMIRGLRNVSDVGYEDNFRKLVLDFDPNIPFVYLFCDTKLEHISSSGIRGLRWFDPLSAERYVVK